MVNLKGMYVMYSCVIFDVDGTMIDTVDVVFATYRKVYLDEFKRDLPRENLMEAFRLPTLLAMKHLGFKDAVEAEEKFHKHLMKEFCNVKPFEGIRHVLEQLESRGVVTGIVTSRVRNEVESDVCLQGLIKNFKYIICADDTEKHKPDPGPLLKLISMSGLKASEILYIGDTYNDFMCAKAAGVDFALALWGAESDEGIDARYKFSRPEELLELYNVPGKV